VRTLKLAMPNVKLVLMSAIFFCLRCGSRIRFCEFVRSDTHVAFNVRMLESAL
jgi:hypothetical protein